MKRNGLLVIVGFVLIIGLLAPSLSADRALTIPKGTRAINLGRGHYKFILPDRIVEIGGLNSDTGSFSVMAVVSRSSPRKLLWGATQGRIAIATTDTSDSRTGRSNVFRRIRLPHVKLTALDLSDPLALTAPVGGASGGGDELSAEELMAAFLKLGTQDPGKGDTGSDLEQLMAEHCEQKNGNWNYQTKKCEF